MSARSRVKCPTLQERGIKGKRERTPAYPRLQPFGGISGLSTRHLRLDVAASAAVSTESKEVSMMRMTTALEAPGLAPWICEVT